MGLLRLLLTMTIVCVHAGLYDPVGGRLAVQLFFLISGFVITMVLNKPGHYPTATSFYAQRVLKIWPEHLVALAIAMALMFTLSSPETARFHEAMQRPDAPLIILANITIIGQDVVQLLPGARHGLALPQMWALGIEFSFYLIAPFVVRRHRLMIALLAASIALRVALITAGPGLQDPWTYRFFPTELAIFMLGGLMERWSHGYRRLFPITAVMAVLGLLIVGRAAGMQGVLWTVIVLPVVALALPHLVEFDSRYRWSRTLGDVCLTIYLLHIPVILLTQAAGPHPAAAGALILGGSVLAGVAMRSWISIPLDPIRKAISERIADHSRSRLDDAGNRRLPVLAAIRSEVDDGQRQDAGVAREHRAGRALGRVA